ncbi:uncharacterized protein LOC144325256 [Podarcis muralis]
MPAMESKVDVMRTPVPFKDPGRSANISEEKEDNPELPLDVYLRRGPIFISEAEEGSGFPDLIEAVRPEARKALELKAEVVTMTIEGAVSRAENRTTSRTGELTATTSTAAPKTEARKALERKAEVVTMTLQGAITRAENRTTSRTGEHTATASTAASTAAPKKGWSPTFQFIAMIVVVTETTFLVILAAVHLRFSWTPHPCSSAQHDIQRF